MSAETTVGDTMHCPSCSGTGKSALFGRLGCLWCQAGQITPADAIRYANQRQAIAEGGLLAGDYSLEELFAERAKCDGIRAEARALENDRG